MSENATQALTQIPPSQLPAGVEAAIMHGDISKLSDKERVGYYQALCKSVGLNPLTRPFGFMKDQEGKIQPYARKECAEQLRKLHRVSTKILSREWLDDLYVITVEAWLPDGRSEESQGIVSITSKGQARANEMMKAETKAKRRATLALVGLGFESDDGGREVRFDPRTGEMQEDRPASLVAIHAPQTEREALLADIKECLLKVPEGAKNAVSREVFGGVMSHIPTLPNEALRAGLGRLRAMAAEKSINDLCGDDPRKPRQEAKPEPESPPPDKGYAEEVFEVAVALLDRLGVQGQPVLTPAVYELEALLDEENATQEQVSSAVDRVKAAMKAIEEEEAHG